MESGSTIKYKIPKSTFKELDIDKKKLQTLVYECEQKNWSLKSLVDYTSDYIKQIEEKQQLSKFLTPFMEIKMIYKRIFKECNSTNIKKQDPELNKELKKFHKKFKKIVIFFFIIIRNLKN